MIAIAALPLMLRMHPRPPDMSLTTPVIVGMILGHVIYGLVVALSYAALAAS